MPNPPPRKPHSAINSVHRDWSDSGAQTSQSSQDIYWSPSPQPQPPRPKLSGAAQRMKDIEDALSGDPIIPERKPRTSQPLITSKAINKRPSPGSENTLPTKKARELPKSWGETASSTAQSSSSSKQTNHKVSNTITAPPSSSSKKGKVAGVFLSPEQNQILKLVQDEHSVFYTGSAGTGKSVLLREIIKTLRKKYVKSPDAVAITASTGIAACNIGGVTIHSFAGIGLGIESAEDLCKKIRKNKKAMARWLRTKVLIIDEVSMVDGDLFDKLARIGSMLRKNVQPFGGIQVIVTGDFFQLPPVTKGGGQVKFAFEAQLWNQTIKRTFNLTQVFRQRDQEFVDMLNEMRFGRLSSKSIAKFHSLSRPIEYDDGLGPTELFPRREDVDRSNTNRMRQLNTADKTFPATDGGTIQDLTQRGKMLANFMAPENLVLRLGAQVMLIKNLDENLVNGSMGVVARFVDPAIYGTDKDTEFSGGIAETSAGIGKDGKKIGTGSATARTAEYPVVDFVMPNGGKKQVLIVPEVWKVELPNGEIQVSRCQFPLILAWAMSIHKSQGQTLERVKVDLGKVFEKGQAYVALSRATSLEGLQVLNFRPEKVQAHPKVAEWSKTLETVSEA